MDLEQRTLLENISFSFFEGQHGTCIFSSDCQQTTSSWNKGETDLQDVGIESMENFAALDVAYAMVSSQTLLFPACLISMRACRSITTESRVYGLAATDDGGAHSLVSGFCAVQGINEIVDPSVLLRQGIEELLVVSVSIRTRTTLKFSKGKALIATVLIGRTHNGGTVKSALHDEHGTE
ncbi:hypothetical protein F4604DRAFT_1689993 [Suillus subluteus]|nr:hypothetical protein F4604DRAFT_1689993 [Suillus subluteus]